MMIRETTSLLTIFSAVLIHTTISLPRCLGQQKTEKHQTPQLADLSGLAWIEGETFIGVHDAKTDDAEILKPRIAQLQLPQNLSGLAYEDRHLTFDGTTPNDLESIAKIPGSTEYLLVESGDSMHDPSIQRIFKATLRNGELEIISQTQWPVKITNVEGTAVAKLGSVYVFVFAERAENQSSTDLCWVKFEPVTMKFAKQVNRIKFSSPDSKRFNRVIVGLDIDNHGHIYSVSAFDAESAGLPNPDNGPYASGVYKIGTIKLQNDAPTIQLYAKPIEHALVDGFKIESIAVRKTDSSQLQLFIGTDDENYGGTLRQLAH
ncbi:hypothetical protein N9B38_00550 [bacterium]|nr:hypothetical protein [bacterium]